MKWSYLTTAGKLLVLTLLFLLAAMAQEKGSNGPPIYHGHGSAAPQFPLLSFAQATPAPKEYKPTEVQTLRLQNKQLVAQIAQRDLQAAQQRFQTALVDLTAEAEKVKVEQGWSKDVQFDPNTLSYTAAPAKEAKKP